MRCILRDRESALQGLAHGIRCCVKVWPALTERIGSIWLIVTCRMLDYDYGGPRFKCSWRDREVLVRIGGLFKLGVHRWDWMTINGPNLPSLTLHFAFGGRRCWINLVRRPSYFWLRLRQHKRLRREGRWRPVGGFAAMWTAKPGDNVTVEKIDAASNVVDRIVIQGEGREFKDVEPPDPADWWKRDASEDGPPTGGTGH